MKKRIWRLAAALMSLLMLACTLTVFAEGQPEAPESAEAPTWAEEEWDPELAYDPRFYVPTGEVQWNDAGDPVLVCGYPVRTVHAAYFDKGQGAEYGFDVDFVDYPFWTSSTEYDGNLAVMSLAMALSASRPLGAAGEDPSLNLQRFLTEAGFENIRKDDYSKTPSMYTVSTAMGSRRMEAEDEEAFTLIAIGVCGSNYQNEWQSNLSPGDGDIHEGFQGAAQLVLDRLAGYIAANGIHGRVKVWISGFSRAAAVSNLTAAALTDTGWLPQDDVYAYTFATPAAVKHPPETGYEHIWNILCPTDPVPQVMPADWGFGRYGTDCYVPVQEFSSIFGGMMTRERARTDRELYGVENNYSPELNLRIRLLLSLVMDVVESREHFNETFQPALVGIMQNKTLPNTLTTLRDVMIAMQGSSDERRTNVDELMDYLIRVFSGSLTRTGLGANDQNSASAMYRLFNEHNENSYLAGLNVIQSGIFEGTDATTYVMVKGPATVTLVICGETESAAMVRIMADGREEFLLADSTGAENLEDLYYMERTGDTTVLAVPGDLDYRVEWTAEGGGTLECIWTKASARVSASYPGAAYGPVRVQTGDTGIAFAQTDGEAVPLEGFTEKVFDALDLARFMGIASLGINWRVALTLICALIAAVICVPLCVLASRKPSRRKQYGFPVWLMLCLFGVAALETEMTFWFFADQPIIRILWKIAVTLCLLIVFFLVHRPKGNVLRSVFPGLLLSCLADVAISLNTIAGAVFFLLSHLFMIVWYQRRKPFSRGRWIQWLVVALPAAAIVQRMFVAKAGAASWAAAAYASVLLLMLFSASRHQTRLRVSATLFVLSDLLLALFSSLMNHPLVHASCIFLFYLSLLLLAVYDDAPQPPEGTPQENP